MGEKEKTQLLGATFNGNVTFNGPMYDIHDNVNVHIHTSQRKEEARLHESEEEIKKTLLRLLKTIDEEGKQIFTEKGQWYAVYKVLSDLHNYPSKMTDFCDIMKNWGMNLVAPACDYESIRKVPNTVVFPTQKVSLWHNYKDRAEAKFKKQIIVAMKLIELLSE